MVPSRQRPHFENNAFRYVRDRSILSCVNAISEEGAAYPLRTSTRLLLRAGRVGAGRRSPRARGPTGLGFRRVNTAQATPLNRGHKQALRHASETPQSSERVQHRALSPRTYTYSHKHTLDTGEGQPLGHMSVQPTERSLLAEPGSLIRQYRCAWESYAVGGHFSPLEYVRGHVMLCTSRARMCRHSGCTPLHAQVHRPGPELARASPELDEGDQQRAQRWHPRQSRRDHGRRIRSVRRPPRRTDRSGQP